MKHKRLTALVLAAALVLAGCGGTKSSSGSAAASQSTGSSQNAPALAVQKERITEQFTLEKTVRDEYGITQKLTIHVPQLVCDSPDAEYINNELAAMYAEEYRDYESYPQAEVSQDEWYKIGTEKTIHYLEDYRYWNRDIGLYVQLVA